MTEITEIKGLGPATAKVFAKGGFSTVGDIARATVADLATVPGVGEVRASSLIGAARAMLGDASPSSAGNELDVAAGPAKKASKKKSKKNGKKKKATKKVNAEKDNDKKSKKGKGSKNENKNGKGKKKKSKKK